MYCRHCGTKIEATLNSCPVCGQAAPQEDQYSSAPAPGPGMQPPRLQAPLGATGHAPPRAQPRPSAARSALQLVVWLVLIFIGIRIVLAIPEIGHSLKQNVTRDIELSDTHYSTMDATGDYVTYTWGVTLRNVGSTAHVVTLKCSFLDAGGIVVETDKVADIALNAGETLAFKDNVAVPKMSAWRIAAVAIKAY